MKIINYLYKKCLVMSVSINLNAWLRFVFCKPQLFLHCKDTCKLTLKGVEAEFSPLLVRTYTYFPTKQLEANIYPILPIVVVDILWIINRTNLTPRLQTLARNISCFARSTLV